MPAPGKCHRGPLKTSETKNITHESKQCAPIRIQREPSPEETRPLLLYHIWKKVQSVVIFSPQPGERRLLISSESRTAGHTWKPFNRRQAAAGWPRLHGRAVAGDFTTDDVLKKRKGNCDCAAHDKRQRGVKPVRVQAQGLCNVHARMVTHTPGRADRKEATLGKISGECLASSCLPWRD